MREHGLKCSCDLGRGGERPWEKEREREREGEKKLADLCAREPMKRRGAGYVELDLCAAAASCNV